MLYRLTCIFFVTILSALTPSCKPGNVTKHPPTCSSPDGNIVVSFVDGDTHDFLSFDVIIGEETVVMSAPLGISHQGENLNFIGRLEFQESEEETVEEYYTMPTGRQSMRRCVYKQTTYRYANGQGAFLNGKNRIL